MLAPLALFFAAAIGLFDAHQDVGAVQHPGAAVFDQTANTYTITGSGENMWGAADAFHFLWTKHEGDVAMTADIVFSTRSGNPHKKAVLMIRQSLDAGSAYVDAALHLEGLTSLQSRSETGGSTHEIGVASAAPTRLRLEKRGDYFYLYFARSGEALHLAGGSLRLKLKGAYYLGLGVCSHEKEASETAVFRNVAIEAPAALPAEPKLYSTLETVSVSSTDRRVVAVFPEKVEAPNWSPDGKRLVFNAGGRMKQIAAEGGAGAAAEVIDTGSALKCNNDHGLTADGKWLAVSDSSGEEKKSAIYVLPAGGGAPRRITAKTPSYWHGWSPDGKTIAFCGQRDEKFDVYTISADGGAERRLTNGEGHNDGPEYSPDGNFIYFNSDRTGKMQIWRMHSDGSMLEQLTGEDDSNNWFPHLSPDGQKMAFLTYESEVSGHPANKDVMLRVMSLADGKIKVIAKLFGGQGTMNVPSWSPDSKRFAFVSYQLLP